MVENIRTPITRSLSHLISLVLVVFVLITYWPVKDFEFTNFDDKIYVTDNRNVRSGINAENIVWAFNFDHKNKTYWHPLSWLSHMLDVQLYGLNPGHHHMTNVIFHILNAVLLFLVLRRMTGALWRPAFVAVLFAVHPLNVESVAWIAERKNLLSTFYCILTLLLYAYYNEKPGAGRYLAMLFCFALGLLAKPMIVTLPFVMLLLDYWPLNRFGFLQPDRSRWRVSVHLVLEKIPLFLLSGLSIYFATTSLHGAGNYISLQSVPVSLRIGNAIVSYVKYIGKMLWPQDLAVLYPFPEIVPLYQSLGAFLLLVGISILFIAAHRKYAYLMIGWFWYLGTLVPVIGLVQAGIWPALADRWAYVPMVGLLIILSWGLTDLSRKYRIKKTGLMLGLLMVVCTLFAVSRNQVRYWENSVRLFQRAVDVTENNYIAENNLGQALMLSGNAAAATAHFNRSLKINPRYPTAHVNVGLSLVQQNKPEQALQSYAKALAEIPDYAAAYNFAGEAHYLLGNTEQAISNYRQAIDIDSTYADAYINLGTAYLGLKEYEQALAGYQQAIAIDPTYAKAYNNLGNFWYRTGHFEKALPNYIKAFGIDPIFAEAYNGAGAALVRMGEPHKAAVFFREAVKIDKNYVAAQNNLKNTLAALAKSKK